MRYQFACWFIHASLLNDKRFSFFKTFMNIFAKGSTYIKIHTRHKSTKTVMRMNIIKIKVCKSTDNKDKRLGVSADDQAVKT